jgi:hypothetical protein
VSRFLSSATLDDIAQKASISVGFSFAVIVLENYDITTSLEIAVQLRTSQLEEALAHRQAFLSTITHEVGVPEPVSDYFER